LKNKKRILFAVLNWGLGHAARSVPIIRELLLQDVELIIGSDNEALSFLQDVFPELEFIELPSYNVRYKYNNMFLNIAPQLPALINVLTKERRFLKDIIKEKKIHGLISDNRYAMSSPLIPSIFITHQLNIKIPNLLVEAGIKQLNHFYLKRFDNIWVPDTASDDNLSGVLGHGSDLKNVSYIGPLSRLNPETAANEHYDIVAILSGPEPQRSFFEKKIKEQLIELGLPALIVRGKADNAPFEKIGNLDLKSFADETEIAALMKGAKLLIARSGYSTIMDLAKMNCRKMLLVPTPGQSEQEYLAERLAQKGEILSQKQSELNIAAAWNAKEFSTGIKGLFQETLLQEAVADFLKMTENKR
jgi:uncharacterized protein (TIGR00661 family)